MARTIFVSAPFQSKASRDLLEILSDAAAVVSGTLNDRIDVVRPDERTLVDKQRVLDYLRTVDAVVADLSGRNPNVLLEVGFAQALGKPLLLLARDPGEVPFDLQNNRVLIYERLSVGYLAPRLRDALSAVLKGPKSTATFTAPAPKGANGTVFVSYSHSDGEYLQRVLVHLRPLERAGLIDLWSDTKIRAGDQWRDEIRKALASARTVVLLVSADFLASDFIITDELPPLLVSAEERGTRIIPVIIKPSRFVRDPKLSRFQALNDPRAPMIRMSEGEREELYAKLAELIERDMQVGE